MKNFKSEHAEQVEVFRWANEVAYAGFELVVGNAKKPYDKQLLKPEPSLALLHAIPNGGARGNDSQTNKIRGAMLKAEGVKKGVPDIFLPVARLGFHGLYIEMKVADDKKGRPSDEQLQFLAEINKQGYCGVICYGAEQAKHILAKYYGYHYEIPLQN